MTSIYLADRAPITTTGLQQLLTNLPEVLVSGVFHSPAALQAGLQQDLPDLLIYDVQLEDQPGSRSGEAVWKSRPGLKTILFHTDGHQRLIKIPPSAKQPYYLI